MNWWQTLIVGNIVFIGAVLLIAWFGVLALCGSPWQRFAGFVGLIVMLNVLGFSNAALRHRPAAQGAVASGLHGSPARQGTEPDGQDLNPDLSASASPATKEQQ